MNYTMTLTGAPADRYKLVYTVHDVSGDQTMTVEQDFAISE
ncbi:hypothetical protein [Neorhizobium galegae]|uniref:Uncharacterized protein n=1 Tax=Neorhizobium galegae bv. orientalis str. HAMBI 540 TaxID=1028800 RepID=A0A068SZR7_NEOGA|nr:hypothetical protein [Neorhizobium galegae]CDN51663.1 Hypothetical protein RG540_PA09870 [Neorhizobium galegae bv. orientalis str. HAMBI 540]